MASSASPPPVRYSLAALIQWAASPLCAERPADLQGDCVRAEGPLALSALLAAVASSSSSASAAAPPQSTSAGDRGTENGQSAAARGGARWSIRELDGQRGGAAKGGDDGWRGGAAAGLSARRWDGGSGGGGGGGHRPPQSSGGRGYRGDNRYGQDAATPAWFTGDASQLRSAHDGLWESPAQRDAGEEEGEADDDGRRLDSSAQFSAAPASSAHDVEASRFLMEKLGIAAAEEPAPSRAPPAAKAAPSFADTRPAWAIQAERELAAHRAQWLLSQKEDEKRAQARAAEQRRATGEEAAKEEELARKAALLLQAVEDDSEGDRLDRLLADKAKRDMAEEEGGSAEEPLSRSQPPSRPQRRAGEANGGAQEAAQRRPAAPEEERELIIPQQSAQDAESPPTACPLPSLLSPSAASPVSLLCGRSVPRVVDPFMGDSLFGAFGGKVRRSPPLRFSPAAGRPLTSPFCSLCRSLVFRCSPSPFAFLRTRRLWRAAAAEWAAAPGTPPRRASPPLRPPRALRGAAVSRWRGRLCLRLPRLPLPGRGAAPRRRRPLPRRGPAPPASQRRSDSRRSRLLPPPLTRRGSACRPATSSPWRPRRRAALPRLLSRRLHGPPSPLHQPRTPSLPTPVRLLRWFRPPTPPRPTIPRTPLLRLPALPNSQPPRTPRMRCSLSSRWPPRLTPRPRSQRSRRHLPSPTIRSPPSCRGRGLGRAAPSPLPAPSQPGRLPGPVRAPNPPPIRTRRLCPPTGTRPTTPPPPPTPTSTCSRLSCRLRSTRATTLPPLREEEGTRNRPPGAQPLRPSLDSRPTPSPSPSSHSRPSGLLPRPPCTRSTRTRRTLHSSRPGCIPRTRSSSRALGIFTPVTPRRCTRRGATRPTPSTRRTLRPPRSRPSSRRRTPRPRTASTPPTRLPITPRTTRRRAREEPRRPDERSERP